MKTWVEGVRLPSPSKNGEESQDPDHNKKCVGAGRHNTAVRNGSQPIEQALQTNARNPIEASYMVQVKDTACNRVDKGTQMACEVHLAFIQAHQQLEHRACTSSHTKMYMLALLRQHCSPASRTWGPLSGRHLAQAPPSPLTAQQF
jgi:hypothetical protein